MRCVGSLNVPVPKIHIPNYWDQHVDRYVKDAKFTKLLNFDITYQVIDQTIFNLKDLELYKI